MLSCFTIFKIVVFVIIFHIGWGVLKGWPRVFFFLLYWWAVFTV